MSTFDDPFDSRIALSEGCPCGRHRSAAEHDRAEGLQCVPVESEEKRYENVVASAVMRAMFPRDATRRAFLQSIGASTALAAISQFFPLATATEVSTIGIVFAIFAGLVIYRQFDWSRLAPMLIETASLSGAILLIIGTATGMAWGLTQSGFSRSLAAMMTGLPGGPAIFIAVSIVAFLILGSVAITSVIVGRGVARRLITADQRLIRLPPSPR